MHISNPFHFALVVLVVCLAYKIVQKLIDRKHDKELARAAEVDGELQSLVERLEERIRVLEKIVTDGSGREELRRQFRDLERG